MNTVDSVATKPREGGRLMVLRSGRLLAAYKIASGMNDVGHLVVADNLVQVLHPEK